MRPQLQLADIHQLQPVGNWPPAIGWWLLLALLLLLIGASARLLYRRYQRKAVLRLSLRHLQQLADDQTLPKALNQLLKRHLKSISAQHPALSLSGQPWRDYLLAQVPEAKQAEVKALAEAVGEALYAPASMQQTEAAVLIAATRSWLTHSWKTLQEARSHAAV